MIFRLLSLVLLVGFWSVARPSPPPISGPTATARPWTRWWWPGSAVTAEGLTAQLETMAAAGLGGVEITPIYGARGAEDAYREFLSPAWTAALAHTISEAARLGMRVDLATGTGWPFGGPMVTPADGSQSLIWLKEGARLSGRPTGMQVKRAAPGGVGLVLDPFSPSALRRYLGHFSPALDNLPNPGLRAQFHDSFEYYQATWTPELARAFAADHGYELDDFGAALTAQEPGEANQDPSQLGRLKYDYRLTLGRLHLQYLDTWKSWAHARGWQVRNQSHGAPANLLDLYGAVDIPETETFGSIPFPVPGLRRESRTVRGEDDLPEPLMMRMASSAAHVMGRPLVSSETATWLREHWQTSLAMVKPEIDRLFAHGINHLVYHGTVYSPPDAAWPGWLFYAATQFNPANPWWRDFSALNAYVTRVQHALQTGEPDHEVLLYWPYADVIHDPTGLTKPLTVHHVDWLTTSAFGRTARRLLNHGITFDYVSDLQLQSVTVTPAGELETPGLRYRTLVVPPVQYLPLATLRRLHDLIAAGGAVKLLAPPADVPGLARLEDRRQELAALLQRATLQQAGAPEDLVAWLTKQGVIREPMAHAGLEFARRRDPTRPATTTYFITNLTATPYADWLSLGRAHEETLLQDPLNGRTWTPATRPGLAGNAPWVQLAPGQSVLVTTAPRPQPAPAPPAEPPLVAGAAQPLTGPWQIDFITGGPELPPGVEMPTLVDWTTLDHPDVARFAGTARYRITFDRPRHAPPEIVDWALDLGDVRESARVRLNHREVGVSWSLPHRQRIGTFLQPGKNHLEIEVTNLAANRIRDLDRRGVDWKIMHEINFVDIRYQPFDASGWPLAPSGLLGPVRLIPLLRAPHP